MDIIDLYSIIWFYKTLKSNTIIKILLISESNHTKLINDITTIKDELFLIFSNKLKEDMYFNPLRHENTNILNTDWGDNSISLEIEFIHDIIPKPNPLRRKTIKKIIMKQWLKEIK